MPIIAADALLGLLHPAWQALIALCLVVVTLLGLHRLLARGPSRMTSAIAFVGVLIVGVLVLGAIAVSCSGGLGSTARHSAPATSPAGSRTTGPPAGQRS